MKIIVRGNKLDQLDCDNSYTIFEIKKSIAKSLNINDLSQINLYFNGVPMQNSEHIENYDLYENAAIDLNFGLAGGKTHGRIGLAGKVRNQTPKVDKKEKTKELTGRAKKRRQYNQRFLNVAIKE